MDSQLRYVYGMIHEVATLEDNPKYWLAFNHTNMHVTESWPSPLHPFNHMIQQYVDQRLHLRHCFSIQYSYTFWHVMLVLLALCQVSYELKMIKSTQPICLWLHASLTTIDRNNQIWHMPNHLIYVELTLLCLLIIYMLSVVKGDQVRSMYLRWRVG